MKKNMFNVFAIISAVFMFTACGEVEDTNNAAVECISTTSVVSTLDDSIADESNVVSTVITDIEAGSISEETIITEITSEEVSTDIETAESQVEVTTTMESSLSEEFTDEVTVTEITEEVLEEEVLEEEVVEEAKIYAVPVDYSFDSIMSAANEVDISEDDLENMVSRIKGDADDVSHKLYWVTIDEASQIKDFNTFYAVLLGNRTEECVFFNVNNHKYMYLQI